MEFEYETDESLEKSSLLPAGEYDFEVAEAVEKVSGSGNPMMAIVLRVFTPSGNPRLVNDYLLAIQGLPKKKLSAFCKATDLNDQYLAGKLTAFDCQSAAGRVELKQTDGGKYGWKNEVETYVKAGEYASPTKEHPPKPLPLAPVPAGEAISEDDIPF